MKFLKLLKKAGTAIFYFFSPYAHPFERKVNKFLSKVSEHRSGQKIKTQLEGLMDQNLAVMNLWMEKKFKGYNYLKKSVRKQKYKNLVKIEEAFKVYVLNSPVDEDRLKRRLERFNVDLSIDKWKEKLGLMMQIMDFLKPGERFQYQESTNFGKLLQNPEHQILVGDCNQIVTLYAHLYSQSYPISDLKIKLPHEHVCLHLFGVDIEATNATFHHYDHPKELLPITELLSTNLLDIHDYRENHVKISERTTLKGAQLAYHLSSNKDLVTKNLRITYHNLAWETAKTNNFDSAAFFMAKSGDIAALNKIYHNAVIYFAQKNNFRKAHFYAQKKSDPELQKFVDLQEGNHFFDKKKWTKARHLFEKHHEKEWIKSCYQGEFNDLAIKVKNVKLLKDALKYKRTYKKMLQLARQIGEQEQIKSLEKLLQDISKV